MSKKFTPLSTVANGCTQGTAPVFCCTETTGIEKNKSVAYESDAARKPASFHLRTLKSRKKRYAPGNASMTRHQGRIEGTSLISDQSKHIYTASTSSSLHHNTIDFMKTLLRKPGLLAMLLIIVSLIVVSNAIGQISISSGAPVTENFT